MTGSASEIFEDEEDEEEEEEELVDDVADLDTSTSFETATLNINPKMTKTVVGANRRKPKPRAVQFISVKNTPAVVAGKYLRATF